MLLQFAEALHDAWHSSRLGSFPGDPTSYTSPALVSHTSPEPTLHHTRSFLSDAVVVVAEAVSSLKDVALLFVLVLVHIVRKWLHHPLLKYVMLLQFAEALHDAPM